MDEDMIFKKVSRQEAQKLHSSLYVQGQGADGGKYDPHKNEKRNRSCFVNYDKDARISPSSSLEKEKLPDVACNKLKGKLDRLKEQIINFNRK